MGFEAKKFATYEDLLNLPDNLIGEIIAGELITSPRPGGPHALASSKLGIRIGAPFDDGIGGPGGWWIIDEPEIHLRGDIVVPDLAGWKKELHPKPPLAGAYTEAPPQWICEVLSPSTAGVDRVRKLPIYLRERVDHVWLIHPTDKTLEVYCRNENQWAAPISYAGAVRIRAVPFDAIDFDLGALWYPE